jgi:hypothetical protein
MFNCVMEVSEIVLSRTSCKFLCVHLLWCYENLRTELTSKLALEPRTSVKQIGILLVKKHGLIC